MARKGFDDPEPPFAAMRTGQNVAPGQPLHHVLDAFSSLVRGLWLVEKFAAAGKFIAAMTVGEDPVVADAHKA